MYTVHYNQTTSFTLNLNTNCMMKKLSFMAATVATMLLFTCCKKKLAQYNDIGASLSNMAFSNNNSPQQTLLTIRLSKPVAGPVHFVISDSGYDKISGEHFSEHVFSPQSFDTVLTANDSVVQFPVTFKGSSKSDLVTINISHQMADTAVYNTVAIATIGLGQNGNAYNPLTMPVLDSGKIVGSFILKGKTYNKREYNLSVDSVSHQFRSGNRTPTFCYNSDKTGGRNEFLGPTLSMNSFDSIFINVKNNLTDTTTTHWHGFHIPAEMDGGPHQQIAPATTWKPFFQLQTEDNAGLYWYHPHLHHETYRQVTMGAAGLVLMRGGAEDNLKLPREYGVDDIPIVLTSRRFLADNSIASNSSLDQFGDYLLTNGVMSAATELPKQMVRIRILNAEVERGYNLGFGDNRSFIVVGTDAGLMNKPDTVKRLYMLPGERIELIVDLSNDPVGKSLDLKAFNTNLEFGFPGSGISDPVTLPNGKSGPAFIGFLSNTDFNLLHITVKNPTAGAIHSIPSVLANNYYWQEKDVTDTIRTYINGVDPHPTVERPFFYFDSAAYEYNTINHIIPLNAVLKWTFKNNESFGHPIHIHDIAFNIVKRTYKGVTTGPFSYEKGWKDDFYIRVGEEVEVIAYYNDFTCPPTFPYMYHCHILTHEDGGLMGQFIVDDGGGAKAKMKGGKVRPVRTEQEEP
jgi:blue copper oxidase